MQMIKNGCIHTPKPEDIERFKAAGWVEVTPEAAQEPKAPKAATKTATKKTK